MSLKKYIKLVLAESINTKDQVVVGAITEKLEIECKELMDKLSAAGDERYYFFYIYNYLENILYKNSPRCEELGYGVYRAGHEVPGTDLVIKLAKDKDGAVMNKKEIELSKGKHGLSVSDLFVKIYDHDTFSEYPCWMVCEKVIPLDDINDLSVLKKIFPTFWSILDEEDPYKKYASIFKDHIASSLSKAIKMSKIEKSKSYKEKINQFARISSNIPVDDSKIDRELFFGETDKLKIYNIFTKGRDNVLPFKEVVWGLDFDKLNKGFSYISTDDLHEGNWGVRNSKNPSSIDLVILDFELY